VPVVAFVSFRLGGTDGVSIETAKWADAFRWLGFEVTTVAGSGPVDHLVPGLGIAAAQPPARADVELALAGADVVIVENLCSLPLNRAAAAVVAEVCRGRPAVLHDHDLAWQRPDLGTEPPPDDPRWRHVTVNDLSRHELAERGIDAVTIHNRFDTSAPPGDRDHGRTRLDAHPDERLFLQPTRALPRKNVAGGLGIAERLGATYWLLGPAEDGFGPELDQILDGASTRVRRGAPGGLTIEDAYASCDLVLLPSSWEGFGNPAVESAVHRRPLCIGRYPVASELAAYGFEWFWLDEPERLEQWLVDPDPGLLTRNWEVADTRLSIRDLPALLAQVVAGIGVTF
jgi:glycosyltransferase involved in cell wall biosynthesis